MKKIRTVFVCNGFMNIQVTEIPDGWDDLTEEEKEAVFNKLNDSFLNDNANCTSQIVDVID